MQSGTAIASVPGEDNKRNYDVSHTESKLEAGDVPAPLETKYASTF